MEYKVFTPEEIERAKTDKDLRNEIVLNYYALAVKLTSSFYARIPRPVEQFDDYLNEALMGINDAITKFDKDKNVEFGSFAFAYARWYIKNLSRRRVYGDKEQHDLENNKAFAFGRMQLMSMALEPEIVFLDEPSAGLDPISSSALDDLVLKLRETKGMTFVVVTHELPSIFKIADRAAMFDKARRGMIALGSPSELREKSEDAFVRKFFNRGESHG